MRGVDGVTYVNPFPLLRSYADKSGTPWATYGMYVDHAHSSALGASIYADAFFGQVERVSDEARR